MSMPTFPHFLCYAVRADITGSSSGGVLFRVGVAKPMIWTSTRSYKLHFCAKCVHNFTMLTKSESYIKARRLEAIETVERVFVRERSKTDAEEFARVGQSFIEEHLVHTQVATFNVTVDELEALGCRREVLFRCLFRLYNSTENEPDIPYASDVAALVASLKDVIVKIERFEQTNVVMTLRRIGMFDAPPFEGAWTDDDDDPLSVGWWLSPDNA
jgi:hypothetical protein